MRTGHSLIVFGKLAQFAGKLKKGAHIQIEGKIQHPEYKGVKADMIRVTSILKLDRAERAAAEEEFDEASDEEVAAYSTKEIWFSGSASLHGRQIGRQRTQRSTNMSTNLVSMSGNQATSLAPNQQSAASALRANSSYQQREDPVQMLINHWNGEESSCSEIEECLM